MLLDFTCLILLALAITGWRMREDLLGRRIAAVAMLLLVAIVCSVPELRTSLVTGFSEGWRDTLAYLTGEGS